MSKLILFDVNETLLDLQALAPQFERVFGDADVLKQWFAQMLRQALVATITGAYADFVIMGGAALDMTAAQRGLDLSDTDRTDILDSMRNLPPHPEVPESLARLRDAGLRLATLTNSPPDVVQAQMENSGLAKYFEQILSVHLVRKFKPAPETYQMAAAHLGVDIGEIRLVAAHDWDIAGAMRAGCDGAFIARPGMVLSPLQTPPDIIGPDLRVVADQILQSTSEVFTMDLTTIDHVLTSTRSVRKRLDLDRPVDPEIIQQCLEIAIQAPTGSNQQGYHFVVVTDPDKRAAVAEHYRNAFMIYAGMRAASPTTYESGDPRVQSATKVASSAMYLANNMARVPALIIPCIDGRVEDSGNTVTQASHYGSILPATWSLMLALRARGLGSAWTTLHLMFEQKVAEILSIPEDVTQAALLPVAYFIGDDFKPAKRVPARKRTYWDTWGASEA